MRLYVARHGQTAWNAENKICGTTDLPLNELGQAQARELAEVQRHCQGREIKKSIYVPGKVVNLVV